jgi:hypothetical protein
MIVVIQCAATKRSDARRFGSSDGKPVIFVADPRAAPAKDTCIYARPDDQALHHPKALVALGIEPRALDNLAGVRA